MQGLVTKIIVNSFAVKTPKGSFVFASRKKVKENGLVVGDKVLVDFKQKVILSVLPRTNLLIRPTFSNLSTLIIVIAPIPKPDFKIVDKLLLFCYVNGINPIICVNKMDIATKEFAMYVKKTYHFCDLIYTSAINKTNLDVLHEKLKGHITAFAGQSAVGKSALVQSLFPQAKVSIGEISKKIGRGKNTTNHSELFELEPNTFLADTPGFSKLDEKFLPIDSYSLRFYYPDFLPFFDKCKYTSCLHVKEKENECGVKLAVKNGQIDKLRYERYVSIFEILKGKEKNGK